MRTRVIWVQSHARRIPDKVNTPPHVEMFAAYQIDQINREIAADLARELERDLRQQEQR